MKYVSIDIETSGLDPEKHQILEFAAIVDNLSNPEPFYKLPSLHFYIKHKDILFDSNTLNFHIGNNFFDTHLVRAKVNVELFEEKLYDFFIKHFRGQYKINVAGKNFEAFDKKFIEKLAPEVSKSFHRRVLDPTILYFDNNDTGLPSLSKCKERAGLSDRVAHNAYDDALDVISLIRYKLLGNKIDNVDINGQRHFNFVSL